MTKEIRLKNGYLLYDNDIMDENALIIEEIEVEQKRQGTGTKLIKKIIEIAQKKGKNIKLCAHPTDDSITTDQLVEFYKKLGFEVEYDDGICYFMIYTI